jgi:hypothetical protein
MKFILFAVTFFTSSFLLGQNPLKKYPINAPHSIFHERNMLFNKNFIEDKRIKEALVNTKILTENQLKAALKYAHFSEYPEALNSIDKLLNRDSRKVWDYKTYWIGSWTEFFPAINNFRQMHLIWIPKDENLHMGADYIPKAEDGFYIIVRSLNDEVPYFPAPSSVVKGIVLKLGSPKMQPAEKLNNLYDITMPGYGHSMGDFYADLKNKYKLNDDEIDVISRSTAIDGWPDSLKLTKRKDLAFPKLNDYNYIKLAESMNGDRANALFWVVPNQTFATGFQPKSELGYFFVAEIKKGQVKYLPEKEDLDYLNSPWWFKNVSSTESYNAYTFVFNNPWGAIASTSAPSNNNNDFTTTTVNGITVATVKKLDRNSPPSQAGKVTEKVKLPSGCATKDMKERFGYINDDETRWGTYKKGVVIAAYNNALTPLLPMVFNISLQKNTVYDIGVIFASKDKRAFLVPLHLMI